MRPGPKSPGVKSGTHLLQWNSPMPLQTQRAHFDPKVGDSWHAIQRTAHLSIGQDAIRALDMNFQLVPRRIPDGHGGYAIVWVAMSMHWAKPGKNGYDRFVGADGQIHMMTRRQRRMTAQEWGYDGVMTWRRATGERPLTYEEAIAYAAEHGVVITAELKSPRFARAQATLEAMVTACKAVGHPAWFMALITMKDARGKCAAVIAAGGQFALIFGRFRWTRKPKDWAAWKPKPTRMWGPRRTRRWLAA